MTTTSSTLRDSYPYQQRLPRAGISLLRQDPNMAKLAPRTNFPPLDQEQSSRQKRDHENGKLNKLTKKKQGKADPVTSPPTSASGQKKRGVSSKPRPKPSSSPVIPAKKAGTPSLMNVIKLQRSNSNLKLKFKDEEPKIAVSGETVELRSASHFYLPKRKLVHKPVEPFKLFIDEEHALAKLVWLYLLESQMPFSKICIRSKEGDKATRSVPAFCKHCIFTDGDSSIGQPTAIIRYICTHYTHNLLMGGDTSQISQGFSWLHWAVSVLHRDLYYLTDGELKRSGNKMSSRNELLKSSLDSVSLYFDMLEKIFTNRQYLLGSVAWFCDSAVALILEDATSFSFAAWPKLQAWLDRVKNQPNWSVITLVTKD